MKVEAIMPEDRYPINPVSKPRMTQRDKWLSRSCVAKYWVFKHECKDLQMYIPEGGATVTFTIGMPKSWSKKKKEAMTGKPHQQKPDVDNYCKAIMDAVLDEDSGVYDIRLCKYWGYEGSITIAYDD